MIMALHENITDEILEHAANSIGGKYFNTLQIVDLLIKQQPLIIEELRQWSPRNWRSVIGRAIKRYAVSTGSLRQASPPTESPARWIKN